MEERKALDGMIHLDDYFLAEVGLGRLPGNLKKLMLQHIYDTLETRVGAAIVTQMNDAQLDDFEKLIDINDEDNALAWLEANLPNYKDVVNGKLEELKVEISGIAANILRNEGIEPEL